MPTIRRLAVAASAATLALLIGVLPLTTAGAAAHPHATTAGSTLPQPIAARSAATWLAGQFNAQGFIPTSPGGSNPDLSSTAQSVLSLSSANVAPGVAKAGLGYLESHVDAYVANSGADGPGQLAQLILDATAQGVDPTSFGGVNLVTRLLATQQTSGADTGLFGTEDQVSNYAAGNYQQGLVLAALAGAGVKGTAATTSGEAWLDAQQCPNGGWTTPDNSMTPCSGLPADFAGPDTNATSLAVQGLVAQGALGQLASSEALTFLITGQDADAGWSYFPNAEDAPGETDPNSTGLVIQALLALNSFSDPALTQGSATPVTSLLGFQLTSGPDAGAFHPNYSPDAQLLATYQPIPALMGLIPPFGPSGGSYWLTGADGGIFAFGHAGFYGSLPGLGVSAHDVRTLVPTADGKGYWLAAADGGVFGFGDAGFVGSLPGLGVPVSNIVGMVATADGQGYWMVGADGGVFAFGDAGFVGSLPGLGVHVNDIVGIVPTASGQGYWMVGADGGVFALGDAGFVGSLPGQGVHTDDIVGITPTASNQGYWMVGADGGVFALGDAGYIGSLPGLGVTVDNIVGIAPTPDAQGYLLAGSTGGVYAFGDAVFSGSAASSGVTDIVAIAPSPARPA